MQRYVSLSARLTIGGLTGITLTLLALNGCGSGKGSGSSGTGTGTAITDGGGEDTAFNLDSTSSSDAPTSASITVDPSNTTVFIDTTVTPVVGGTQTFKVTLQAGDGPVDVSSTATFALDNPALGTFAGPTFTSATSLPGGALGVTATAHVSASGQNADAKITIVKLRKTPDATGRRDFFFTVPYKAAPDPAKDVLLFGTNIQKVDVVFVEDTTGSMSGETAAIQSDLSTRILPALAAKIPSVGIAIVGHDDYPINGHGDGGSCGDQPVYLMQTITTDVSAAQKAVNALAIHCGGDIPESQIPALHYVVTGNAITWPGGSVPKHHNAPGTTGGVDFRTGAAPVVVEITDASWHDGGPGSTGNSPYEYDAPTLDQLKTEFNAIHAKFVHIAIDRMNGDSSIGISQGEQLCDATGSVLPPAALGGTCPSSSDSSGKCRLSYRASSTGTGVSDGIIAAIQGISVGASYDITYRLSNDTTNKDATGAAVDATKFIKQLRAMGEGDVAHGCDPAKYSYKTKKTVASNPADDTFVSVVVGTPVCFEVQPQENDSVQPADSAQFFNAFINMVGEPGDVDLGDKRTVLFLVPPKPPLPR